MQKELFKSGLARIGVAFTLVAAIVVGIGTPALAAENRTSKSESEETALPNVTKGKVTSVDAEGKLFEVQPKEGEPVTFTVDSNTRYFVITAAPTVKTVAIGKIAGKIRDEKDIERGLGQKKVENETEEPEIEDETEEVDPEDDPEIERKFKEATEPPKDFFSAIRARLGLIERFGSKATFGDIEEGDGIIVRSMPNEDLAKDVLIIKTPVIKTLKGTVTAVDATSITITPAEGEAVVLTWNADTKFILEGLISVQVGQQAAATYNSETMVAKTVTVKPAAAATTTN